MITDQQVDRAVEAYRFSITKCERPEKWEAGVGHVEAIRAAVFAAQNPPVSLIFFVGSFAQARWFADERGFGFGPRRVSPQVCAATENSISGADPKSCRYTCAPNLYAEERRLRDQLIARGVKEFDPTEIIQEMKDETV